MFFGSLYCHQLSPYINIIKNIIYISTWINKCIRSWHFITAKYFCTVPYPNITQNVTELYYLSQQLRFLPFSKTFLTVYILSYTELFLSILINKCFFMFLYMKFLCCFQCDINSYAANIPELMINRPSTGMGQWKVKGHLAGFSISPSRKPLPVIIAVVAMMIFTPAI